MSDQGSVRRGSRVLKLRPHPRGYRIVDVSVEGRKCSKTVHRLVALAFLPLDPAKPHVNHLDGDKANNAVANLEWCSASANMTHAYAAGLRGAA